MDYQVVEAPKKVADWKEKLVRFKAEMRNGYVIIPAGTIATIEYAGIVTHIKCGVESKPPQGESDEPKTLAGDKTPESDKPTLKEVKDSILKCADLDELKEVWTHFNKELRREFTPEEIKEIESVKNAVKDKLFDAPAEPEAEISGKSKPVVSDDDEAKYDADLAEIAMALNECDSEKAVNAVWKNSMNIIAKLKGVRLSQIMQIKKENLARVRKNA